MVVVVLGIGLTLWTTLSVATSNYVKAEKLDSVETVLATGKITGKHVIPVAFTVSGVLEDIWVAEGAQVEEGQVLAFLGNHEEKNRVLQRTNALEIAQTQLGKIQTTDYKQALENLQQAKVQEKYAQLEYERSLSALEIQPEERLKQARVQAETAQTLYNRTKELVQERSAVEEERLRQAEVQVNAARSHFSRSEALFQEGIISQVELDAAKENVDISESVFNMARRNYEGRMLELESEMETVKKNLDLAASNLALAESDFEGRFQELEQAERSLEVARSNVSLAQSALDSLTGEMLKLAELETAQAEFLLEEAELAYAKTYIKALSDGHITKIHVSPGEFVQPGREILTLIPLAEVTYADVQVDEDLTGRIVPGQEAMITSTAFPGETYPASVSHVAPGIDAARGTFKVRLALDRLVPELVPDLAVFAEIIIERRKPSIVLEQRFVYRQEGKSFVNTTRQDRVYALEIQSDNLGNGFVLVREGLEPGAVVLTNMNLQEGQRVRLAAEER